MRLHLDRGDDVNARDEQGMTLLMLSAARNNGDICRLLLAAGAAGDLLDAQGNDALAIAIKVGAGNARLVLEAHLGPSTAFNEPYETFTSADQASLCASEAPHQSHEVTAKQFAVPTAPVEPVESPTHPTIGPVATEDWEAEDHQLPQAGDPSLVAQSVASHLAITLHIPLDTSADWSDFEVFLPDSAAPLQRGDDVDLREGLHLLLLRALRESSVPSFAVEDLSRQFDGSINEQGESHLRMVLNDLGAELDERLEIEFPFESHVVFVNSEETEEEEAQIDAAMDYLDDLASRRNDPLRIYLKTGLREKLLTADQEVSLAKAMEGFVAKALDALSEWSEGLARVCDSAQLVRSGIHPLRWMTAGQDDEMEELEPTAGAEIAAEAEEPLDGEPREVPSGQSDSVVFFAGIDLLKQFMASTLAAQARSRLQCRQTLDELHLKREFLLGLATVPSVEDSVCVAQFNRAIDGYLSAREQMTTANLKLAVSVAKKFLYTEEPFDDLIQEGNIGLMKAVDKFDWRRGFRFSTYATLWIKQSIQRHVADKCCVIRIPVHVHETTQKILRHMQVVEMRSGRVPSPREIADAFSMPLKKVSTSLRASALSHVGSLDEADESLAIEFSDQFVPVDPASAMRSAQVGRSIDELLSQLKPKSAGIIRMHYGLGINDAMTLDEIGQRFELTRERIRQVEAKALRLLQHPSRLAKFEEQIFGRPDSYYAELEANKLASLGFVVDSALTPKTSSMKPAAAATVFFKDDILIGDNETLDDSEGVYLQALDEVLEEARGLGINVDEREEDGLLRIWIEILETPDTPTRMLVWRLLDQGFKFWPQKGYWK